MAIENISLFQAMNAKMAYLTQRQKVISQNVANADTPGYIAQDLAKADFSAMVSNIDKNKMHIGLDTSDSNHMLPPSQSPNPKVSVSRLPYDVKPDGNSVALEEQMVKSNDVQLNYTLMVNLYRDSADMIRTSLGRK